MGGALISSPLLKNFFDPQQCAAVEKMGWVERPERDVRCSEMRPSANDTPKLRRTVPMNTQICAARGYQPWPTG